MVAYCSHTRRLAVGSRLGHIALYELRSSRCQLIPAHDGPISALAFSPEGKVLASFSFKDKRISFYQVRIALFIDVKYKDILISRFRDRSKKKNAKLICLKKSHFELNREIYADYTKEKCI